MRRSAGLGIVMSIGCGPTVATPSETGTGTDGAMSSGPLTMTGDATGTPVTSAGPITSAGPSTTEAVETTSGGTSDTGASSTGEPPATGPPSKLLILYTPHGFYEDQAFDEDLNLGPMLEPLSPWKDAMLVVDEIRNVGIAPDGEVETSPHEYTYASLLTGGILGSSIGGGAYLDRHYAGGPSLDVVLGQELGAATPFQHVHLGVQVLPALTPGTVSYLGADEPNQATNGPLFAASVLFGGFADPLIDALDDQLAAADLSTASGELEAHFAIAHVALALDVSPVVLLSIDEAIPNVTWAEFGHVYSLHEMLVTPSEEDDVVAVQTFWAEQLALFLEHMDDTGTLDETIVVWVSDMGDNPAAHSINGIFTLVLDTTGTFVTGQVAPVDANQADLAVTIAASLGVALEDFGHELLAPTIINTLLVE